VPRVLSEIASLATIEPPHVVTAEDTRALLPRLSADARQAALLARMVPRTRIRRRHVALPPDALLGLQGVTSRAEAYERLRLELGVRAAEAALAGAGAAPGSIEAVLALSSTGYRVPSLDAYLVSHLSLDVSTRRVPITELGCAAGVAGMGLAGQLLRVEGGHALVVTVELCSLSIKTDHQSDSDAVGNLLFGDAAAAVVVGSSPTGRGPEVLAAASILWPGTDELLGMQLTDAGFRLILSPSLPEQVRVRLRDSVHRFLAAQGVAREDVRFWAIHPGGPKVLDAVTAALELSDADAAPTWRTWESHGNISSATVFFVLQTLRDESPPPDGALGLMLAFGPGVTCELVLLRARGWLAAR
jgi:alkylresorcinol/alkylpyrone synthase